MKQLLVAGLVIAMLGTALLAGAQEAKKKKRGAKKGDAGFVQIFNGKDLTGWTGNTTGYKVVDGTMVFESGGNIYTEKEYSDFDFKFEFKLTPGANNGVGLRAPLNTDAAYSAMEIQILDDPSPKYATIKPYQHTGSIYGVVPAKTGQLKPTGEWNQEEIIAVGTKIKVILNGVTIVDADIAPFIESGETPDHKAHPGLKNKTGHIGFLGHGTVLSFRNLYLKDLSKNAAGAKAGKGKKKAE